MLFPRSLAAKSDWDSVYHDRLGWWSPTGGQTSPPRVQDKKWPRNPVDNFILAGLEAKGLKPAIEADRRTLARRLSFALTGLPPKPEDVERFATRTSQRAYDEFVDSLIASPHFGEHWARHWMDVVHYADTHDYEWDAPAKNARMYRDYLIGAFNADIPYRQLVLEQLAGDLIEPRIDHNSGLVESLMTKRRHG